MDDSNIYLIGFMGCGKSAVSAEIAARLGFLRLETDDEIVRREGMPITEIFEKRGEAYFRDAEARLILETCKTCGMVVSCGGGAALRRENADAMKAGGTVALLTASPETVLLRVSGDDTRPLLLGNMNVGYIREKMEERRAAYEYASDFSVATDGKSIAEVCDEIIGRRRAICERR